MSNSQLDFLLRPSRIEEANKENQLSQLSLSTLNSEVYSSEQIEVLVEPYSTEFSTVNINWMVNTFNFFNTISPINPSKPPAIVACIEDIIIGYASIRSLKGEINSHLSELFVHPDYVRRGVGTQLLRTLENNVADESKVINLYATLGSEAFYHANGYNTVADSNSFIRGIPIPLIYMEKWLVTPSETDKFFWDISQQTKRNIKWLATETETLLREAF